MREEGGEDCIFVFLQIQIEWWGKSGGEEEWLDSFVVGLRRVWVRVFVFGGIRGEVVFGDAVDRGGRDG